MTRGVGDNACKPHVSRVSRTHASPSPRNPVRPLLAVASDRGREPRGLRSEGATAVGGLS